MLSSNMAMGNSDQQFGGEVKKQFDFMMGDVLKERKKHMLASLHYNCWGFALFSYSAAITLAQAFLASLNQSDLVLSSFNRSDLVQTKWQYEYVSTIISLSIAFLAAYSVFIQSLIKYRNFQGRAALHDSAAAALGKIYKTARLKARKKAAGVDDNGDETARRSRSNLSSSQISADAAETTSTPSPSPTPSSSNSDEEHTNLLALLVAQFEQATESCSSLIPAKIISAFDLLENIIEENKCNIKLKAPGDQEKQEETVEIKWETVTLTLYGELTAVIISQRWWPYLIPDPYKVVKQTMDNYRKLGKEEHGDLLVISLLDRHNNINEKKKEYYDNNLNATASKPLVQATGQTSYSSIQNVAPSDLRSSSTLLA